MDKIAIHDLEVFCCVGVGDEERARPQRLLLTIEMSRDLSTAVQSDELRDTIDYFVVSRDLLKFSEGRSWKLLEKMAADIADRIVARHEVASVTVAVKKFVIPEARHVSVSITRSGP